ncbi:MAG: hypothetical protein KDG54_15805 [Geminicoccaceae bacterium]|nr:hypothetical protein [Geminicoccaceae bacterium]
MTWQAADISALQDAIKQGVRTVEYREGRRVTYHSLDEMLRLLAVMRAEVEVTDLPLTRRYTTRLARIRRGY